MRRLSSAYLWFVGIVLWNWLLYAFLLVIYCIYIYTDIFLIGRPDWFLLLPDLGNRYEWLLFQPDSPILHSNNSRFLLWSLLRLKFVNVFLRLNIFWRSLTVKYYYISIVVKISRTPDFGCLSTVTLSTSSYLVSASVPETLLPYSFQGPVFILLK